jgi:hypothetical protein
VLERAEHQFHTIRGRIIQVGVSARSGSGSFAERANYSSSEKEFLWVHDPMIVFHGLYELPHPKSPVLDGHQALGDYVGDFTQGLLLPVFKVSEDQ